MHRILLVVTALCLVGSIVVLSTGVETLGLPGWMSMLMIGCIVVFGGVGLLVLLDARRVKDGSGSTSTRANDSGKHDKFARGMGNDAS